MTAQSERIRELQNNLDVHGSSPETVSPDQFQREASVETEVRPKSAPEPKLAASEVNVNLTDEATISALPTIGPILAKRIVAERVDRFFSDLDDLAVRCALMPHQVERIRPLARFVRCVRYA